MQMTPIVCRRARLVTVYGISLLSIVMASGCGSGGSAASRDATSDVSIGLAKTEHCLARLGAARARERTDVEFFLNDLERGNTVKPGMAGNGIIDMAEYRPVTIDNGSEKRSAPSYLVWIGGSVGEGDEDPAAVVEDGGDETLVMFVRHPSRSQARAGMKCLETLGEDLPKSLSG